MFRANKIILASAVLLFCLCSLIFFANKQAQKVRRDPKVLLDRYYLLQHANPLAAKKALLIILQQEPKNLVALKELIQINLNEHDTSSALTFLTEFHQLQPNEPQYSYALAHLYYKNGEWGKAYHVLMHMTQQKTTFYHYEAQNLLVRMSSCLPHFTDRALTVIAQDFIPSIVIQTKVFLAHTINPKPSLISLHDQLLNRFYALKKHNKKASYQFIKSIIRQYPNHILALKEGAFLAIDLGHRQEAIDYLVQVYNFNHEPAVAMQLGYLYSQLNAEQQPTTNPYLAYHYFTLATSSKDKNLGLRAQNALTNLSGTQTKVLPEPYFMELFFDPLSQSRFGLTVRPFIGRLGLEGKNRWEPKAYLFFAQTEDDRSFNLGQLPQIYNDNVRITGVGVHIKPMPALPIVSYLEVGRAYDLIYQNRNRWQNDLRGGFMFYKELGAQPAYCDTLKWGTHYYGMIYSDLNYFSRYANNFISTFRTRQGIRLAQYRSSMLNLYVSGHVIEDTNRYFYNNFAEIGPGVSFIPSNRYKVELRFEHVNGTYLPVNQNKSPNPYGKYYTNNTVFLLLYAKL